MQLVMVVPSYNFSILEADSREQPGLQQTSSQPLHYNQEECTRFPLIDVLTQVWKFVFQTLL